LRSVKDVIEAVLEILTPVDVGAKGEMRRIGSGSRNLHFLALLSSALHRKSLAPPGVSVASGMFWVVRSRLHIHLLSHAHLLTDIVAFAASLSRS